MTELQNYYSELVLHTFMKFLNTFKNFNEESWIYTMPEIQKYFSELVLHIFMKFLNCKTYQQLKSFLH